MIPDKVRKAYANLIADRNFSEILTGSAWSLSARILVAGLGLAVSIIISRNYGAEVVGIVAIVNAFFAFATIFSVLGTSTSILRFIPEHISKYSVSSAFKVYRKVIRLVVGSSIGIGILLFLSADFIAVGVFENPKLSVLFSSGAVLFIFKSVYTLNIEAIRGLRLIKTYALMQVLPHGFNLLLIVLLGALFSNSNIPVYALLFGFSTAGVLSWIVTWSSFRNQIRQNDRVIEIPYKTIFSISIPMLMASMMSLIIGQTGVIVLGVFRSEAEVGYYAIAVKLATLTAFVLNALNSIAAPKFSELFYCGDLDELINIARKSSKVVFWATTPILIVLILFGKYILGSLFGTEFIAAYGAMVFLIVGQFVNSIAGSTGIFMNMTGRQKEYRNIMALAAALNIVFGLLLVPLYGIMGAAFAGMCSLIFWNVYILYYIKKKHGRTIGYIPFLNY